MIQRRTVTSFNLLLLSRFRCRSRRKDQAKSHSRRIFHETCSDFLLGIKSCCDTTLCLRMNTTVKRNSRTIWLFLRSFSSREQYNVIVTSKSILLQWMEVKENQGLEQRASMTQTSPLLENTLFKTYKNVSHRYIYPSPHNRMGHLFHRPRCRQQTRRNKIH